MGITDVITNFLSLSGIPARECVSLGMTIRTEPSQVVSAVVEAIAINMVHLQSKFLAIPQRDLPTLDAEIVVRLQSQKVTASRAVSPGLVAEDSLVRAPTSTRPHHVGEISSAFSSYSGNRLTRTSDSFCCGKKVGC